MVGSPEDNDAGPMLRLNNGGHVWTHTLDISDSKLSSLSLVLSQVQEKLNPGVEVQVTEQEFAKFMEMVFDDWTTSDLHYMARLNSIIPSMNDIGFRFGFLREAAPASAGESGKRKPRARAMQKQEASKVTKTKHAHRQAGSPVWFMVEISNGIPGITLRDSKCWMLSANTPVQTAGNTIEDAMFKAMKRHDGFYTGPVHTYNLEVAIFVCRNRLINWANGANTNKIPEGEKYPESLADITLCRNVDCMMNGHAAATAALARLKALPAPRLIRS